LVSHETAKPPILHENKTIFSGLKPNENAYCITASAAAVS